MCLSPTSQPGVSPTLPVVPRTSGHAAIAGHHAPATRRLGPANLLTPRGGVSADPLIGEHVSPGAALLGEYARTSERWHVSATRSCGAANVCSGVQANEKLFGRLPVGQ